MKKCLYIVMLVIMLMACLPSAAMAYDELETPQFSLHISDQYGLFDLYIVKDSKRLRDVQIVQLKKAWDVEFKVYGDFSKYTMNELKDMQIAIVRNGEIKLYDIPMRAFEEKNSAMSLDADFEMLSMEMNLARVSILLLMRLVLVVIVETAIFILMGFTDIKQVMTCVGINVVTQVVFEILLTLHMISASNLKLLTVVFINLVLIELIAFLVLLKLDRKSIRKIFVHCTVANAITVALSAYALVKFPV